MWIFLFNLKFGIHNWHCAIQHLQPSTGTLLGRLPWPRRRLARQLPRPKPRRLLRQLSRGTVSRQARARPNQELTSLCMQCQWVEGMIWCTRCACNAALLKARQNLLGPRRKSSHVLQCTAMYCHRQWSHESCTVIYCHIPWYIFSCTALYCHVLLYTAIDTEKYILEANTFVFNTLLYLVLDATGRHRITLPGPDMPTATGAILLVHCTEPA